MQNLKNPKFEGIPPEEEGDYMTLKEWQDTCHVGCFINDDGVGLLATATQMSDVLISPSQYKATNIPDWATHVVWFNQ